MRIVNNDELRINIMAADKAAGHESLNQDDAKVIANYFSVACRLAAAYLEEHGDLMPGLRERFEKLSNDLSNGLSDLGYYNWR